MKSEEYAKRRENEPITFIIKKGYGAHRASGLYMFDEIKEKEIRAEYEEGRLCGKIKNSLLAQLYISNPLLLDRQNKFDFRIYMLIASVNPLIVYYHDGFLRVSLQSYDKNSTTVRKLLKVFYLNTRNLFILQTHIYQKSFLRSQEKRSNLEE